MASRLAGSPKSPPRRVIMPALPSAANMARAAATAPLNPSPLGKTSTIVDDLADSTVEDVAAVADGADATQIETGPNTTTPPQSPPSQTPILDNDPATETFAPRADDDVFGATANERVNDSALVTTTAEVPPQNIMSNIGSLAGFIAYAPRPDRVSQVPNATNAQGLYPPDALIFIANLSNKRSEDELIFSCHRIFDTFGTCHIKVRWDKNRHPFAFVQFEKVEDSSAAVDSAGACPIVIDGRKIRIEFAKAERAVILSKRDGTYVTEPQAHGLLAQYGPISDCIPVEASHHPDYSVPQGMYVKFAFYLDCRDALRGFPNRSSVYALHLAPSLEPRFRTGLTGNLVIRGFNSPRSAVDKKSIFVGNLPESTTRRDLEELFKEFGSILHSTVIKKPIGEHGVNVFAFMEFNSPEEADLASVAVRTLHGYKLRIEPKERSLRRPHRSNNGPSTPVRQRAPRHHAHAGYAAPPMNFNGPDMYSMPPMVTPPHGYNHGMHMAGFAPNHHGMHFATPPNQGYNGYNAPAMPMGMFSPSPHHNMHNMHAYGVQQYGSPVYGGGHVIGSIAETSEEEY